MKFANLAALVATIASTVPSSVSASTYSCQVEASFETMADAKNPTVPSKTSLEWVSATVRTTFESSYTTSSDMDMLDEKFNKFSMKRKSTGGDVDVHALTDASVVDTSIWGQIKNLRVGKNEKVPYDMFVYGKSSITCRRCRLDDDAALGESAPATIEEALADTPEHKNWVADFCSSLQMSKDFPDASGCAIIISNCHDFDGEGANEVEDGLPGIENYIISDARGRDNEEGSIVYALQMLE